LNSRTITQPALETCTLAEVGLGEIFFGGSGPGLALMSNRLNIKKWEWEKNSFGRRKKGHKLR